MFNFIKSIQESTRALRAVSCSHLMEEKIAFLSVCNSPYVDIVKPLLVSLDRFHGEIKLFLVCVNMSREEISSLELLHNNMKVIIEERFFEKKYSTMPRSAGPKDHGHEEGYCTSCRSWFMRDIMECTGLSVFYLDADVFLKEPIDELFPMLLNVDCAVRAKKLGPEQFECNAGMVWFKNTEDNLELVKEWVNKTLSLSGTSWRSNQWALNYLIRENWEKIKYLNFPDKFNGMEGNPKTVIVHRKGIGRRR